jgi:hypothetical protein
MFDANGVLTTDASLSKKNVYMVTLEKLINGEAHTGDPAFVKLSSASTFSYTLITKSKPPLGGRIRIKCVTPNNEFTYTEPFSVLAGAGTAEWRIHHDCPKMYQRV